MDGRILDLPEILRVPHEPDRVTGSSLVAIPAGGAVINTAVSRIGGAQGRPALARGFDLHLWVEAGSTAAPMRACGVGWMIMA